MPLMTAGGSGGRHTPLLVPLRQAFEQREILMSSYVSKHRGEPESLGYKDALLGVVCLLLGLLVGISGFVALLMWLDARNARDDANQAKVSTTDSMAAMPGMTSCLGALTSFAGAAPANADALAAARKPFPATLPAVPAGPVANVKLALTDINIQIAPGVRYSAWAWAGGAPGPVIHVRQGQLVKITLTNNGAIPHSVDFHAARIAPTRRSATSSLASLSATAFAPTTPACSCITAA